MLLFLISRFRSHLEPKGSNARAGWQSKLTLSRDRTEEKEDDCAGSGLGCHHDLPLAVIAGCGAGDHDWEPPPQQFLRTLKQDY